MASTSPKPRINFGPYEVTDQVFYTTPLTYCLVNIKPILPGHVLVIPHRCVPRFTDLHASEVSDLFLTVQRVQRMLARKYFTLSQPLGRGAGDGALADGSFNIALQDGPDSGQTVPHVHVHVIPRVKGNDEGDGFYARLQGEQGNVGGGWWDAERGGRERPVQRGMFPQVKDEERFPRGTEEMNAEAEEFRRGMEGVE